MKLYRYKPLDAGFVILCDEGNTGRLRGTVASIQRNYPGRPYLAVVGQEAHPDELREMKKFCPVCEGGKSITSLINVGMANAPTEWVILVMSGSYVRPNLDSKFSLFVERKTDILFPIVDGRTNFVDATLNGIFWHRDVIKEVGEFSTENSMEICKLMWTLEAIEKGFTFKAVQGTKIC